MDFVTAAAGATAETIGSFSSDGQLMSTCNVIPPTKCGPLICRGGIKMKLAIVSKRTCCALLLFIMSACLSSCYGRIVTWQEIQPSREDVPFYNTLWQLEYFDGHIYRERGTIKFRKNKRAGGKSVCNGFSAYFELGESGSISIQVNEVTKIACGRKAWYEREYFEALATVTSYEQKGEYLALFTPAVERGLIFRAH
jgi:heat shock protein HslJ